MRSPKVPYHNQSVRDVPFCSSNRTGSKVLHQLFNRRVVLQTETTDVAYWLICIRPCLDTGVMVSPRPSTTTALLVYNCSITRMVCSHLSNTIMPSHTALLLILCHDNPARPLVPKPRWRTLNLRGNVSSLLGAGCFRRKVITLYGSRKLFAPLLNDIANQRFCINRI